MACSYNVFNAPKIAVSGAIKASSIEALNCFQLKSSKYELETIYLPDCEIIIYEH
jgi:hypothetical protein